jgi:uroporphyrinogen decarboxylase
MSGMTGRERVKAALDFTGPDRVPRDLGTLSYVSTHRKDEVQAILDEFPMEDLDGPGAIYPPGLITTPGDPEVGEYIDEWGSVWSVAEEGVVGEVKKPALEDWAKLAHWQPPWDLIHRRDLSKVNQKCEKSDRFMLSECNVRIFERLQFLRGTQNLFYDIGYGRSEFFKLMEMVHDFFLQDLRAWCATDVDAVFMMDDWGAEDRLLIHPDTWRAVFKPLYREYCDVIHSAGKYVFFHSDGNIQSIYGDLIEIGMNAINSQLFTMDIEELGRLYKGKVTFWGEIDRQFTLPFGTPEDVRANVKRVRQALDTGKGGVMAHCEWGKYDPIENIRAVYQSWLEDVV